MQLNETIRCELLKTHRAWFFYFANFPECHFVRIFQHLLNEHE